MLRVDPKDRVNISQVCEFPKLQKIFKKMLGKERYMEEFSDDKNVGEKF